MGFLLLRKPNLHGFWGWVPFVSCRMVPGLVNDHIAIAGISPFFNRKYIGVSKNSGTPKSSILIGLDYRSVLNSVGVN